VSLNFVTVHRIWGQRRGHALPEWVDRYDRPRKDDRLPNKKAELDALLERIGGDGAAFLSAIGSADAPAWLREVPAVDVLRRVWIQNYTRTQQGPRWRTAEHGLPPSAQFVSSPYDTQAHYARKRTTTWVGYKVHLTEACDDESPHLITHVATTQLPRPTGWSLRSCTRRYSTSACCPRSTSSTPVPRRRAACEQLAGVCGGPARPGSTRC
jgi:hypothetical protein